MSDIYSHVAFEMLYTLRDRLRLLKIVLHEGLTDSTFLLENYLIALENSMLPPVKYIVISWCSSEKKMIVIYERL